MRSWEDSLETSGSQEAGMSYHQRTGRDLSIELLIQVTAEQTYEPTIGSRPFNLRGVPAKCPG